MPEATDPRLGFVKALVNLARQDERVVVVVNDSVGSSKLNPFQDEFSDRMINVGIAEQNMVGVAAGLAASGKLAFVSCAGSFLSARALEQIKIDVAYAQNPIILCAQSPGMAYGNLGPTHHSLEDIAIMRSIAGLAVVSPGCAAEAREAITLLARSEQHAYIRIPRQAVPNLEGTFELGRAKELNNGSDITIASHGIVTHRVLAAAEILNSSGIKARVLHFPTIKPLDQDSIIQAAKQTGAILVAEEATAAGALGSAIAEVTAQHCPVPVQTLAIDDVFAPTGSENYLLDHFGMAPSDIAMAARQLIAKRS